MRLINNPFAEIMESASDDEGATSPRNINDEANIEEDQECIAETHLKEVGDKQGLSPIKRGRSRHRRNGKKLWEKTGPSNKGKSQN